MCISSMYVLGLKTRPVDLHMAQPNVPVGKTGHMPPARLVPGARASDAGRPHSYISSLHSITAGMQERADRTGSWLAHQIQEG
jgi:hypothetical protein